MFRVILGMFTIKNNSSILNDIGRVIRILYVKYRPSRQLRDVVSYIPAVDERRCHQSSHVAAICNLPVGDIDLGCHPCFNYRRR